MGQKKTTNANFKPFESKTNNGRHLRITHNMMDSTAWQVLKPYEQILYIHMKKKYNGKPDSEKNISYTYKEGQELMSKQTFTKSMDKLIEVGLVDLIKHRPHSAECNIYGLSKRWHDYGAPNFQEKRRPKFSRKQFTEG